MRHKVIALLLIVIPASLGLGIRYATGQAPVAERTIVKHELKPKLGLDYESTSVLKLATRKQEYRKGEMMRVDLALLNTSSKSIFFRQPRGLSLTFEVRDENGSIIKVLPNSIEAEGISANNFTKIGPDEMPTGDREFLIGCDGEEFVAYREARILLDNDVHKGKVQTYDKGMFDRNLFSTWGDACLQPTQQGRYTLTASISNMHVVVSPSEPNVQTAVGTIRSAPLTIQIIK